MDRPWQLSWIVIGVVLLGCPGGHTTVGDDDTAADDDCAAVGDDDSGDDDTTPSGDDDDSAPPGDDDDSAPPGDDDDTTSAVGPDFRDAGSHPVVESSAALLTSSGCTLEYDLYQPQGQPIGTLVVLAHGLECGREHVADTGRHLASWGLSVAAPDLCHSTVLDLDQEQNGLDMVDLADDLSAGPVIYAGHSAGGLAALVATAADADAVAMLGHDPTEWMGIAADVSSEIDVPAYGLIALPGLCNALNNIVPIYASLAQGRALRVVESGHCDYSNPDDCLACNTLCGNGTNNQFTDEEILRTILGLSTAFLVWQSGLDATGEQWWSAGQPYYGELLASGAVSEL